MNESVEGWFVMCIPIVIAGFCLLLFKPSFENSNTESDKIRDRELCEALRIEGLSEEKIFNAVRCVNREYFSPED